MHSFMDEVRYNKQGNKVTMVKIRTSEASEDAENTGQSLDCE